MLRAQLGYMLWSAAFSPDGSRIVKIYVGNLSFQTTDSDLNDLFAQFGEAESVNIITDALSEFSPWRNQRTLTMYWAMLRSPRPFVPYVSQRRKLRQSNPLQAAYASRRHRFRANR